MGGMFGLKRKKKKNVEKKYIVMFNCGGIKYYMDWPATDIDPDSPTFGNIVFLDEVRDWVWEWVRQEAANNGVIDIGTDRFESRSLVASMIIDLDVVDPSQFRIR
jgi:hypothetical protein